MPWGRSRALKPVITRGSASSAAGVVARASAAPSAKASASAAQDVSLISRLPREPGRDARVLPPTEQARRQLGAEDTRVRRTIQRILGEVFREEVGKGRRRVSARTEGPQIGGNGADLLHQNRHRARTIEWGPAGDALK